jgi:outer membrane protein assembly factor BamB
VNTPDPSRLVKGAATAPSEPPSPEDWPCYRKDGKRSNATAAAAPAELAKLWEVKPSHGPVSPLSVADGLVFGAETEGLQVFALEAETGKERWRYVVGGRVDVPPFIEKGLCVFGSKDGWVHCLDAKTGQFVWRYRAAPSDARMVVSDRMESPWPVTGGVLVQNDAVFVCTGRSYTMDGGMQAVALELATGKCLWTSSTRWAAPNVHGMSGPASADMFVGDGQSVYMNGSKFDPKTGVSVPGAPPAGILQTKLPGRMAIEQLIWNLEPFERRRTGLTDGRLDAAVLAFVTDSSFGTNPDGKEMTLTAKGAANWSVKLPVQGLALAAADKTIYCAGIPADRDMAKPCQLLALSAADGSMLKTIELDARPSMDGLALARGRLYLATQNGKVFCFGKQAVSTFPF